MPLDNFGSVKFTNASATIGTTTGPIDAWQSYAIDMASGGSRIQDSTSALTDSNGTSSFTVTYSGSSSVTPAPHDAHVADNTHIADYADDSATAPPLGLGRRLGLAEHLGLEQH